MVAVWSAEGALTARRSQLASFRADPAATLQITPSARCGSHPRGARANRTASTACDLLFAGPSQLRRGRRRTGNGLLRWWDTRSMPHRRRLWIWVLALIAWG